MVPVRMTEIIAYSAEHLSAVLKLTERAWDPVFPLMRDEIPKYVYDAFYPDGWQKRQLADVEATCLDLSTDMRIALTDARVSGYLGLREHPDDSMGEIYIIAVDPDFQRQGVGEALMAYAFEWMRQRGLSMAMVETGDDAGHSPSRAAYESAGFERYPVARYFRKL